MLTLMQKGLEGNRLETPCSPEKGRNAHFNAEGFRTQDGKRSLYQRTVAMLTLMQKGLEDQGLAHHYHAGAVDAMLTLMQKGLEELKTMYAKEKDFMSQCSL